MQSNYEHEMLSMYSDDLRVGWEGIHSRQEQRPDRICLPNGYRATSPRWGRAAGV